jgi:hypothetical protein
VPGNRTGPQDTTPEARINVDLLTDTATLQAAAVKSPRCKFLHPQHLTGCRQLAEPGSDYCARHQGGGP